MIKNTCIVDEDINLSEMFISGLEEILEIFFLGNISRNS